MSISSFPNSCSRGQAVGVVVGAMLAAEAHHQLRSPTIKATQVVARSALQGTQATLRELAKHTIATPALVGTTLAASCSGMLGVSQSKIPFIALATGIGTAAIATLVCKARRKNEQPKELKA